ncbi:DUF6660 family protein [Flavihumibacter petaseus]|uniref:DUF6660 family protein n=1 Tax=Flavihumibacter petaseus TaxID=549295 RepID=UPI00069ABF97|nr:DUF6660 family protein [Flavihumibacter petaseus]
MKSIFYLLAIWILSLSCLPCSDSRECSVPAELKVSSGMTHDQHNHSREGCTPFCTCSCCAVTTICSVVTAIQVGKPLIRAEKHILYLSAPTRDAQYTIWQPPRQV